MKYTELPKDENPRSRIRDLGPMSLSASEVLAVALWVTDTETGQELARLYQEYGSINAIPRYRILEIKGLGDRYADAIQAIGEIIRREAMQNLPDKVAVHSPADAAALVQYEMGGLEVEQLRVILLNTRNQIKRVITLYQGSTNCSMVRVGELFRDAVRENATAIILVHNHPSGDPTPSPEDVALTRSAVTVGKAMDIDVLDHLVIGKGKFVSLKERGLGFSQS
jgi:DNA repair protein RadC